MILFRSASVILLSAISTALLVQDATLLQLGKGSVITGLFAMIILNGLARAMYSPAMFTMLGMIVPRDLIAKAAAMSSTVWQAAVIEVGIQHEVHAIQLCLDLSHDAAADRLADRMLAQMVDAQ